jgi:hypothetical protein
MQKVIVVLVAVLGVSDHSVVKPNCHRSQLLQDVSSKCQVPTASYLPL